MVPYHVSCPSALRLKMSMLDLFRSRAPLDFPYEYDLTFVFGRYGLALLWSLFWALFRDGSLTSVGKVYLNYFFTLAYDSRLNRTWTKRKCKNED